MLVVRRAQGDGFIVGGALTCSLAFPDMMDAGRGELYTLSAAGTAVERDNARHVITLGLSHIQPTIDLKINVSLNELTAIS